MQVSMNTLPASIKEAWAIIRSNGSYTTELQCAKSGIPSLKLMQNRYGREQMIDFLVMQINNLHRLLNIENVMDVDAAIFAAESILDEFGLINLSDLRLVFTRAIRGQYGQFYNRITIPQMMDWFRKYFEERCNVCAQASEAEAMRYKEADNRTDYKIQSFINNLTK